jgi:hypothetical protein
MVWYQEKNPKWKPVPMREKVNQQCPRCGNTVDFQLGYFNDGLFLAGIKLSGSRIYGLHCPICVHFAELDIQDANRLKA